MSRGVSESVWNRLVALLEPLEASRTPSSAILSHLKPRDGFQEALKKPQEAPKGPALGPLEASWDLQGPPEAPESFAFYKSAEALCLEAYRFLKLS